MSYIPKINNKYKIPRNGRSILNNVTSTNQYSNYNGMINPYQIYNNFTYNNRNYSPKKYQFGGNVNNEHAIPIMPGFKDELGFQEIQTEVGELAMLPNGSIVDVKADKRHKYQDKNNITDYFPEDTYIFSRDPKMKFGPQSKIEGVSFDKISLGKSNFKYKENEFTEGPKDIMLNDVFFKHKSKKEITTAEIAKNIKDKFPLIDMRDDLFADRAIEENKEQREFYGEILKTFSEYKKPKSAQDEQELEQQAQYGKLTELANSPYGKLLFSGDSLQDIIDRPFAYGMEKKKNPLRKSGEVPKAQFGWLGEGIDSLFGISNNAMRKQERKNRVLQNEAQGYRNQLQSAVDNAGMLNMGTNMASYAASLNVPLQRYDDMNQQQSMMNAGFDRTEKRLNNSKYMSMNTMANPSSMARYTNMDNYGAYLGQAQSQANSMAATVDQQLANLDMQRAQSNTQFVTAREAARNNALNTRDTQLYNANVTGITNVGRAAQEAVYNSGTTKYQLGMEKMSYDDYLNQRALAEKRRVNAKVVNMTNEIGTMAAGAALGGAGLLGSAEGMTGALGGMGQAMGFGVDYDAFNKLKEGNTTTSNPTPSQNTPVGVGIGSTSTRNNVFAPAAPIITDPYSSFRSSVGMYPGYYGIHSQGQMAQQYNFLRQMGMIPGFGIFGGG